MFAYYNTVCILSRVKVSPSKDIKQIFQNRQNRLASEKALGKTETFDSLKSNQ